jgi:hypothetical protein
VIDTHGHADHISGGVALAAQTGASYHLHPYDAIHPIDVLPAPIPYEFIREGQRFEVGRHEMKEKSLNSLEEMMALARELGLRMIACEMSRDLIGIIESELVAGLECGVVASFLADSLKSRRNLLYLRRHIEK